MTLKKPPDFRPFVSHSHPKVANCQGLDAHQHAAAAIANPIPRDLIIKPWMQLYQKPFVGVTTDGRVIPGLYRLEANGAPIEAMIGAASNLLGHLDADQRARLTFAIDAREWRRWNNTEMYLFQQGLRLDEISVPLRESALAVVRASLSAIGYDKVRDVMRLNQFLGELVGNTRVLNEWSYNFTLFGAPSACEPWGWQLMGHHLAPNCLVIGGQMGLSPLFMGAEPCYADEGQFAGKRLFQDEEYLGLELMRTLSDAQRQEAILCHSMIGGDLPPGRRQIPDQLHLAGAFQDNRIIPYEGVPASAFSPLQRRHLLQLIAAYVEPMPAGPLTARLHEIERHLDETHFCWIGGVTEDDTFYYRIQSPVILIEFDQHSGVFLANQDPARFHIHTIVRSPNGNDYGIDLLRLHYELAHGADHLGG
jgi:hypothetical protein